MEEHKVEITGDQARENAKDFVSSRSNRKYTTGHALINPAGQWQVWFEGLDVPIIDPIHVIVLVDIQTGVYILGKLL